MAPVTHECSCGGLITADPDNQAEIPAAVEAHNRTIKHQYWRVNHLMAGSRPCKGTTDTFCMVIIPDTFERCPRCEHLQFLLSGGDRGEDPTGKTGVLEG